MQFRLDNAQKAFQQEVIAFLNEALPSAISDKVANGIPLAKDEHVQWQKRLFERGWAAQDWPVAHGGSGWSAIEKAIWAQQTAEFNAPEVVPFGLSMVAPVIIEFGNAEQQQRFLPDILASDTWWCQGYSEPEAGSDLAAIRTTATLDGDHYLVNGVKSWVSYAHFADWMFCLVRTGEEAVDAHAALSFLLIPLNSDGVTVTAIKTMDGLHELNEVRLENVRVDSRNRIGDEGQGWDYAKFLLEVERTL